MSAPDDIHDDIDALISELNATTGTTAKRVESILSVEALLAEVIERRGSDLLLVAGTGPSIRVDGAVVRIAGAPLDGTDIEEVILPLLPARSRRQFEETGITDSSLRIQGLGRFRVN